MLTNHDLGAAEAQALCQQRGNIVRIEARQQDARFFGPEETPQPRDVEQSAWAVKIDNSHARRHLIQQLPAQTVQNQDYVGAIPPEFRRDDQALSLDAASGEVVQIDRHRHDVSGSGGAVQGSGGETATNPDM